METQPTDRTFRPTRNEILAAVLCAAVFAIVLLRNAWMSDDAYITFRTIDNFLSGHGLRWNVDERVQTFTNPLWLMMMTPLYLVTREFYYTSLVVSFVISLGCFCLIVVRSSRSAPSILLIACILIFSKAFVDYCTSGLENPLTHLILIVTLVVFLDEGRMGFGRLLLIALLAGWGTLNRMDTLLIFLPILASAAIRYRRPRALLALALGFIPFIAWEAFCLVYYGFPFPNTAYAKLGTGISSVELLEQGLFYFLDSLELDPVTLFVVVLSLAVPFIRRDLKDAAVGLGIVLYCLYVLKIGGDFMSGRFLTAPFVCAAVLVARLPWPSSASTWLAVVLVGVMGWSSPLNPVRSGKAYDHKEDNNGIVDERGFYFYSTGLLNSTRNFRIPRGHLFVKQAEREKAAAAKKALSDQKHVARNTSVGIFGYYCGPRIHVLDVHGITEPLLARLPAMYNPNWRIGHTKRSIPRGYERTLASGENLLGDENLAAFYDKLVTITRGRIFSWKRFVTIVKMNTGAYDHLVDEDAYLYPGRLHVGISRINKPKRSGTPWDGPGTRVLPNSGIRIDLEGIVHASELEISLDHNDDYKILFQMGDGLLATAIIESSRMKTGGLAVHRVEVPQEAARKGYDTLIVMPHAGDKKYSLGHVLVADPAPPLTGH